MENRSNQPEKLKKEEKKSTFAGFDKWAKKFTTQNVKKGVQYLSEYGVKQFGAKVMSKLQNETVDYELIRKKWEPTEEELEYQKNVSFSQNPKISIAVPAYKTPENFLHQLIESVLQQTYSNFELCIADGSGEEEKCIDEIVKEYQKKDERIRFLKLPDNYGIAGNTNQALKMADGEYIGVLDHDDLLAPNALFEMVKEINQSQADCLYSDEDKVSTDLTRYFDPHCKPDFDFDLLRSNNYICHFFVVKKQIFDRVGGFNSEFEGSQDYDFIFRCVEQAKTVKHISKVLYHWRIHPNSVADNPASKKYAYEAGKRAIEAHLKRCGWKAQVLQGVNLGFYNVSFELQGEPLVSIVLRGIEKPADYKKSVAYIKENTIYKNYEIIKEAQLFRAKGDYLLFLNAKIRPDKKDWLEAMIAECQRPEVGAVGAKINIGNEIYHAGIFLDMPEIRKMLWAGKNPREYEVYVNGKRAEAAYVHSRLTKWNHGYFCKAIIKQQTDAVSGVCMMMKRNLYFQLGGFHQSIDRRHSDIEFCLKLRNLGYHIIFVPGAELTIIEN